MANALYDPGREGFLDGSIDWDTDTIKAMLVKTAQSFNAAHKFVSELSGANIVQRSAARTGKTVTNGVADADDVTLSSVPTGSTCVVVGYKDTGNDATSRLIYWQDTGTLLPVATNGGNITVQEDAGANRIFKL